MSITTMNDVINPEVMGDMINAKLEAQLKITPYARVDTSLKGVPGDTKKVPSWNYIGDAVDVAEGDEVSVDKMTSSSVEFTIKKAMKSVGITQEAINSGYGDPVGQATSQLAKSIAGKVDSDILNAAYGATMTVDTGDIIGYSGIVDAVTKFEDEEDGIEKVMFIHPAQENALLKDELFLSADKFVKGVAVNGAIGKIAGCWIKKSKKVSLANATTEVKGVYTVTIGGTVVTGDTVTIAGKTFTVASTQTPTALATLAEAGSFEDYTVTRSGAVLTFTEKTGGIGGKPICTMVSASGTCEVTVTTAGVKAKGERYICPILKMEADSAETEYTETELPAITIFLKADTTTDVEHFPKKQTYDITSAKYYGVALTNNAKVVLAEFSAQ